MKENIFESGITKEEIEKGILLQVYTEQGNKKSEYSVAFRVFGDTGHDNYGFVDLADMYNVNTFTPSRGFVDGFSRFLSRLENTETTKFYLFDNLLEMLTFINNQEKGRKQ